MRTALLTSTNALGLAALVGGAAQVLPPLVTTIAAGLAAILYSLQIYAWFEDRRKKKAS